MAEKIMGAFISVLIFLGVFAIISNTMPHDFFIPEEERRELDYIKDYEGTDIFFTNITDYDNDTITCPCDIDLFISTYKINIILVWNEEGQNTKDELYLLHWWYWFGFWIKSDNIEPYPLTKSYVLSKESNNASIFTMSCKHHEFYVQISFDTEKYNTLEESWDDGELQFYIGVGYEKTTGAISGWTLISKLLTFQTPEVHPLINAIIGLTLWSMIAFIIFTIIIRILPFFGGG